MPLTGIFYHVAAFNQFSFTGFLQLNELSQELQCERSVKELNVHRSSETEELISSLTAEREQFRTQLQENVEMVGNWKTSHDILRCSWTYSVILKSVIFTFLLYHFRLQRHKFFSRVYRMTFNTTDRRMKI